MFEKNYSGKTENVERRLYIGNLSYKLTTDELREEFETVGKVLEASIVVDRGTGESKGFGFIEFADAGDAQRALHKDGQELAGRVMRVNPARARGSR